MIFRHILALIGIFYISMPGCTYPKYKSKYTTKTINDFSRLNETKIHTLATPSSYEELQKIIRYAQANNLKIAMAGSRHSQGGHAFFADAIVINLKKLNKILDFNPHKKLITVQTGATWKDIQEFLQPHGLAVKIMQFVNIFTIGGSLSVNCNGVDPHFGPLIESVQSIKILLADGSIVTASRSENSELFSLAIGGYGLFGVILEATLQVVEDELYKPTTKMVSLEDYIQKIKTIPNDPKIGFHFGYLTFRSVSKNLFGKVVYFDFNKFDDTKLSDKKNIRKRKLNTEKFISIKKVFTKLWANNKLAKASSWIPETIRHTKIISRNNIMRPDASHVYIETPRETNLLQEYFIPVDNLISFIASLEKITKDLNFNLMLVSLRFIPKNTENFLSYTTTDRIGIVLFFNQKITEEGNEKTKKWTQHLIEAAAQLNGTYYLPIQLHATKEQTLKAYPKLNNFFELKKKYDSSELFMNYFYNKYSH